ncbi:adenylylsulfate kinase [Anaerocolumna sp. AGMB13025]|uniref:adenylylsulfate kinase n=1 Tax=Anaerocolumna sp. AGMB13025 TaxID=3039116 RepID=UPI00241C220F|nr:adenylylsulfate kinase [Anaerocolumna sp. AGMB13025]WFR59047.1 adenylylsulfate kinase [Anaerocolumna sp. AGMB13025]
MKADKILETSSSSGIQDKLFTKTSWTPVEIESIESIPKGDMPGDKVIIGPDNIKKAQTIFPVILDLLIPVLKEHPKQRAVISVFGGSGVGKSGIASLISYYLNELKIGSYTISGDNYPHRIPKYNDAERLRVFRQSGIRGLLAHGKYRKDFAQVLKDLQQKGVDSDPEYAREYSWLKLYQESGRNGLKNYLGTEREINFQELNSIIARFKNGEDSIYLKRMGREETDLWYEEVDFADKDVMILEWTHGNNHNLQGIDFPIMLNSTPKETLEQRKSRNRGDDTDSPFIKMVLALEQEILISQAKRAKMIVAQSGEIVSYRDFVSVMLE